MDHGRLEGETTLFVMYKQSIQSITEKPFLCRIVVPKNKHLGRFAFADSIREAGLACAKRLAIINTSGKDWEEMWKDWYETLIAGSLLKTSKPKEALCLEWVESEPESYVRSEVEPLLSVHMTIGGGWRVEMPEPATQELTIYADFYSRWLACLLLVAGERLKCSCNDPSDFLASGQDQLEMLRRLSVYYGFEIH
jgi:hypothetical protein